MKNTQNIIRKVFRIAIGFTLMLGFMSTLSAQQVSPIKKPSLTNQFQLGYIVQINNSPVLNFYAAYNPTYRLTKNFSLEGQVSASFSKFEKTDYFLGAFDQLERERISVNTLVGLRAYLTPSKYDVRLYTSLLGGIEYQENSYLNSNRPTERMIVPSGSIGLFLEYKNITAGLSFENENQLIFKAGYSF